ncbi:MAG TPA: hypothetical protein VF766_05900, partial [Pyrinomonadaceae bacterium]
DRALDRATLRIFICLALCLASGAPHARAQGETPCAFEDSSLSYQGTQQAQARCLLRPVLIGGRLGAPLQKLPAPLDKLIGKPLNVTQAALQRFLAAEQINEADLGGSLSEPISRVNSSDPEAPRARYFVIHDVSTPNYLDDPFPPDINEASWIWNDLNRKWLSKKVTHVYVSRTGESVTAVDFKTELPDPHHGTKFARDRLRNRGKGLYLHVELVQPRRRDPQGPPGNDRFAPMPGFTDAQLKRLALLYLAASVRRGEWMIPAFHAVVDAGIADAHDDPQNFDTTRWCDHLRSLLESIKTMEKKKAKSQNPE